jgi:hypothetical protein
MDPSHLDRGSGLSGFEDQFDFVEVVLMIKEDGGMAGFDRPDAEPMKRCRNNPNLQVFAHFPRMCLRSRVMSRTVV